MGWVRVRVREGVWFWIRLRVRVRVRVWVWVLTNAVNVFTFKVVPFYNVCPESLLPFIMSFVLLNMPLTTMLRNTNDSI